MKKAVAMVMAVMMVVVLSVSAFAAGSLSFDQAKMTALNYAGVNAADATFTKAKLDLENGRMVYEFEFYANSTEYDVDVDANTGDIVKFTTEHFGGYNAPNANSTPSYTPAPNGAGNGTYYDDWDDMYDRYDDVYDYYDDMYDRYDDVYDHYDDVFDRYDDMFDFD